MKKLLFILFLLVSTQSIASQWDKSYPVGTTLIPDLATDSSGTPNPNNAALDRLLANYREGLKISYSSGSALAVSAGEITVSNSDGSVRLFLQQASAGSITFANIDTGAEASSTTYYVFAGTSSTSDTTPTFYISTSPTAPSGVTYYKRLGSFYNNSSSDIEQVTNDSSDVLVSTGTIASGGTISVPSGYVADQCDWMVAVGSLSGTDAQARGLKTLTFTASTSRVVTATITTQNWVDGATTYNWTGTANYTIICTK